MKIRLSVDIVTRHHEQDERDHEIRKTQTALESKTARATGRRGGTGFRAPARPTSDAPQETS